MSNVKHVKFKFRFLRMKAVILIVLFGIINEKAACFKSNEFPSVVQTKSGLVIGKPVEALGEYITSFQSIPYAQPPLGELRFKKPLPVKKWNGILEATAKPPPCMQYSRVKKPWISMQTPSENCLFLNVWTPAKYWQHTTRLPVLVWIYAGGFYSGSSDLDIYDGSVLASYGNVVVVSMNYRVGSFGFLTSGTEDAPGNMGLYDQNLALKWVQENIEYFGGNPKDVTLFGESAGSMSIGLHILSPISKGLFHKAIMESGSPINPEFGGGSQNLLKSNHFAHIVGCANESTNLYNKPENVLDCLKRQDPFILARAEESILVNLPYYFFPISGDEFMPISPIEALMNVEFSQIKILIGNVANEGNIFLIIFKPELLTSENSLPLDMKTAKSMIYDIFQNSTHPPPELIQKYYLEKARDSKTLISLVGDTFGDCLFVCPDLFFAEKMQNAYYYWITHKSPKSPLAEWMGVAHFSEVPYVFGEPLRHKESYTDTDCDFSEDLMKIWISFAKNGKPTTPKSNEKWENLNANNPQAFELHLDRYGTILFPRKSSCEFWRKHFISTSE